MSQNCGIQLPLNCFDYAHFHFVTRNNNVLIKTSYFQIKSMCSKTTLAHCRRNEEELQICSKFTPFRRASTLTKNAMRALIESSNLLEWLKKNTKGWFYLQHSILHASHHLRYEGCLALNLIFGWNLDDSTRLQCPARSPSLRKYHLLVIEI